MTAKESEDHERLEGEGRVKKGVLWLSTLTRHFTKLGLMRIPKAPKGGFRCFQKEHRNYLWQADLKYGPHLPDPKDPKKTKRTYLVAFIDDFSRLVPHAEFYFEQKLPLGGLPPQGDLEAGHTGQYLRGPGQDLRLAKKTRDGQHDMAALTGFGAKSSGIFTAFDQLKAALRVLAEGGNIEGRYVPGLDKAGEGLGKARDGVFRVLLSGGEIQGQQVPGLDTAGTGLAKVHDGLDRMAQELGECSSGAVKIKDGAGAARSLGSQRMYQAMSTVCDGLSKAEAVQKAAAARVQAYDHFIGKPAGAKGEVRFLLRTEELR